MLRLPIYLTKNGYGSMVVMSLEHYSQLTDEVERKLEEADCAAMLLERVSHDDVFSRTRETIQPKQGQNISMNFTEIHYLTFLVHCQQMKIRFRRILPAKPLKSNIHMIKEGTYIYQNNFCSFV